MSGRQVVAILGSLLKDSTSVANEPVILVSLQLDETLVGMILKVEGNRLAVFSIDDLVDPSAAPMAAIAVVTFAEVVPIGDEYAAIRSVFLAQAPKPRIVGM